MFTIDSLAFARLSMVNMLSVQSKDNMFTIDSLAFASDNIVGADPGFKVTLSVVWFTFLISVASPMVTGFITKRFADSQTKTIVLILVTTFFTVLSQIGREFEVVPFLTQLVIAFFTAVGLHYQLLKPLGVTGSQGIVNKATPDFGIGHNYNKVELPEAKGGPGDDTFTGDPTEVETGDEGPTYDPQDDPHQF